jgi:hypothetical protein
MMRSARAVPEFLRSRRLPLPVEVKLEMTDATSRKLSIRTCIHFCTNDDVTDDAFSAFVPLGQRQHGGVGRLVVGSFGNRWPSIDERLRLVSVDPIIL